MSTNFKSQMAVTALMLAGLLVGSAHGDFYLFGEEQITIDTYYDYGELYESSQATIVTGGSMDFLVALDSSTVEMSGGYVYELDALGTSVVNLSGGSIEMFGVWESSTVTFYGQNFQLGTGLSFDGDRLLGTGFLSGEWMNGTPWTVDIYQNDPTATITTTPEPATLLLLGLGGLAVMRKRRN